MASSSKELASRDFPLHYVHVVARRPNDYNSARPFGPRNATPARPLCAPLIAVPPVGYPYPPRLCPGACRGGYAYRACEELPSMHLTTEAGDPVAPVLFEEDSLGLAPNIVLPEPLPDEDDSGDDPLRTYLREIHEVNLLTADDERMLACRMEEMICLDEVRAELAGAEGGQPSGTAIALRLYERVYERRALAEVLSEMERIDDASD